MMRRTSITAFAALALFLAMVSLSRQTRNDVIEMPLDFSGINTLHVESKSPVDIRLSAIATLQASYSAEDPSAPRVSRQGRTLRIDSDSSKYGSLSLTVPVTIQAIEFGGGQITTKDSLRELLVRSPGAVQWRGDVQALRIVNVPEHESCKRACDNMIAIEGGTIGDLFIAMREGNVSVLKPDDIASIRLQLGPSARFGLSNASRIDQLRILPYGEEAKPVTTPAQ